MILPAPDTPQLKHFADVSARVDRPMEIGRTALGLRRVVNILGGEAQGDGWTARIVPGGADYQLIAGDTLALLEAHYVLETDAGDRIYVHNSGYRAAPAEVTAKLLRGELVDPALVYFRCIPKFQTGSTALAWINERLFVGSGVRHPDRVVMRFFELA
jgi:Protein of unknown function (DUF3237)